MEREREKEKERERGGGGKVRERDILYKNSDILLKPSFGILNGL